MIDKRKYIIGWGIVLIVVISFFGWRFFGQKKTGEQIANENQISTTTEGVSSNSDKSTTLPNGDKLVVAEPKPQKVNVPEPGLTRPFPDTSKIDQSFVAKYEGYIKTTIENLKKDGTSFYDWIDLGFERKQIGDYEGAKEAWEYVSLLYPGNSISFGNLADLYTNFLKDYAKAEINYKTAIKNSPSNVNMYTNLFGLYILEKKNTEAINLLKEGIAKNPNTFDLQVLLAIYYRDAGNITLAKDYYDQAISIASKQNNTSVVTALKAEENSL